LAVLLAWRGVRVIHGFIASLETDEHQRRHVLKELIKERVRLHEAESYEMTALRMILFSMSARKIQRWWRAAKLRQRGGVALTGAPDPSAHPLHLHGHTPHPVFLARAASAPAASAPAPAALPVGDDGTPMDTAARGAADAEAVTVHMMDKRAGVDAGGGSA